MEILFGGTRFEGKIIQFERYQDIEYKEYRNMWE